MLLAGTKLVPMTQLFKCDSASAKVDRQLLIAQEVESEDADNAERGWQIVTQHSKGQPFLAEHDELAKLHSRRCFDSATRSDLDSLGD